LWPLESQQFLGNSDSADQIFMGNFRPLEHNIFTQNLNLSMYVLAPAQGTEGAAYESECAPTFA
jgi:hypothetical protein